MNIKIALLLMLTLAALPSIVSADSMPLLAAGTPTNMGISVSGHAEVDAKPDVAYANLGVVVQTLQQADAVSQDAAKADAVKDALIKAGVAETDIKTDYYQVEPQYDNRSTPATLIGYQVSNFFKVTIHDLPKAGVIVDKATQAGANQVNGITYDLSDRSKVEGEALAKAVANARSKADIIAGVAGVTVGRLINLDETGGEVPQPRPFPMMMRASMAAAMPPTTPLAPQDIVVTSDITALYAIEYGK